MSSSAESNPIIMSSSSSGESLQGDIPTVGMGARGAPSPRLPMVGSLDNLAGVPLATQHAHMAYQSAQRQAGGYRFQQGTAGAGQYAPLHPSPGLGTRPASLPCTPCSSPPRGFLRCARGQPAGSVLPWPVGAGACRASSTSCSSTGQRPPRGPAPHPHHCLSCRSRNCISSRGGGNGVPDPTSLAANNLKLAEMLVEQLAASPAGANGAAQRSSVVAGANGAAQRSSVALNAVRRDGTAPSPCPLSRHAAPGPLAKGGMLPQFPGGCSIGCCWSARTLRPH